MNKDIRAYNTAQKGEFKKICLALVSVIDTQLTKAKAESKVWHGSPVWFFDGNPVAGYRVLKESVQLLFWSGQSFDEPGLEKEGSFKAAQKRYVLASEVKVTELKRWLVKAKKIQWDYKNIVKRKGVLERLK